MFTGIGAAIGGSLVGGLLGNKGAADQNSANAAIAARRNEMEIQEAAKARDFSRAEAITNRSFQERMSNSAVTRRMSDLKKAGINPLLAGKFDATTPAGSIGATAKANAHGYEAKNKLEKAAEGASNALAMRQAVANIENIEANTDLTKNKTGITEPLNRMMNILDNIIQGGLGSAQQYKEEAGKVRKQLQTLNDYISGKNKREADEIRNAPGIEVTPHVKESQKTLRYKNSKRNRTSNRSKR